MIGNCNTLAVVIITRDHEQFISECLESIEREFPNNIKVFIVDVGSLDGTMKIVRKFIANTKLEIELISVMRNTTPLGAFKALVGCVKTTYISVISGDDFFLEGYGISAADYTLRFAGNRVVHFAQLIVDERSQLVGSRRPRWASNPNLDRKRLLYSNPGTTAGCLLPWNLLQKNCLADESFDTMIEDYFFNCRLVSDVIFHSEPKELVAYRKHKSNLTSQSRDFAYALSIGICIREAWKLALNPIEKFTTFVLFLRWGRHLSIFTMPKVFHGFLRGTLIIKT